MVFGWFYSFFTIKCKIWIEYLNEMGYNKNANILAFFVKMKEKTKILATKKKEGTTLFSQLKFPEEIAKDIAKAEKEKRKKRKLTQKELSARAGVSLGSLKRFEQTGEISFVSLIRIADVLGETDMFVELFKTREYTSIQEVIDEGN